MAWASGDTLEVFEPRVEDGGRAVYGWESQGNVVVKSQPGTGKYQRVSLGSATRIGLGNRTD